MSLHFVATPSPCTFYWFNIEFFFREFSSYLQAEVDEETEGDLLEKYSALKEDDLMTNEVQESKPPEREKEKTNKFKKIFRRIKKSVKLNCLQLTSF